MFARAPGSAPLGTWIMSASHLITDATGHAGFDWGVVDMEHAPHTFETAYRCIVQAQGLGMKALVRLPDDQGTYVQRILDSGADGVLIPRVRHAEDARAIIDGMRFSPLGSRGLGITSRAGHWGLKSTPDYVRHGNTMVFRGVQLEDVDALEQAAQILSVDGVNAAFVGPGDLALSSGKPASHPDNVLLIDRLLELCRQQAIPCGTAVGDAAAARQARDRGFSFVMVSNDASIFAKAAAALAQELRS